MMMFLGAVFVGVALASPPMLNLPIRVDFTCAGPCNGVANQLDSFIRSTNVVGRLNATDELFVYTIAGGDVALGMFPVYQGIVVHASGRYTLRLLTYTSTAASGGDAFLCCYGDDNVATLDVATGNASVHALPPRAMRVADVVNYVAYMNGTLLPDDGSGVDAWQINNDTTLFYPYGNANTNVLAFNRTTRDVVRWCPDVDTTNVSNNLGHQWCHASSHQGIVGGYGLYTGIDDGNEWIHVDDAYRFLFTSCSQLPRCTDGPRSVATASPRKDFAIAALAVLCALALTALGTVVTRIVRGHRSGAYSYAYSTL
jgi:hypothetical protein